MTTESSLTQSADLSTVTVAEAMSPGVITTPRGATVGRIAAIMTTHGIHTVVVSGPRAGVQSAVDDLDVVRAAVEDGEDADAAALRYEPMATVPADTTLAEALSQMAIRYVTHLLVTDPVSGEPAGMVSGFDVAAVVGGHDPRYARMLRPAQARPASSARRLCDAVVGDVMHLGVVACSPDAPLAALATTFAAHRVHCVAIAGVDSSSGVDPRLSWQLVSVIDLIVGLNRDGAAVPASSIGAGPPVALGERETVDRAAKLMLEHGTRHLVVVGRTGLPAGIVSTLDIARIIAMND